MRILDRYVIKAYLGPMMLTFFIVVFVLLLQFLWLYIDDLIGKGLSPGVIAEFLFWGTMTTVPLALPLSTMLASIMTMGGLGEDNELLAMKAAGISLQRIMRPLMVLVLTVGVGAFFVTNNLVPYSMLKMKTLKSDIQKKREVKIPAGIFYNIGDMSLYITKQDDKTGLMHNILFYDHSVGQGAEKRSGGGNRSVTLADSGYIRPTETGEHVVFLLYNGNTYEEEERNNPRDTTFPFTRRHFTRQEVLTQLPDEYSFQRSDGENLRNDAQTLSIAHLALRNDSLTALLTEEEDKFLGTVLSHGHLPDYYLHDSLMQQKQLYTRPLDSLFNNLSTGRQRTAALQTTSSINRNITYVSHFINSQERNDALRRRVDIEWHRKFTLSIACIIFFFLGAPLGAIIRKGGLGAPTIVSIGFFIVYWVVDISGLKLARDGVWSPAFGAWLSSAVLLPIGIFLTYKATTDSSLFNADKYLKVVYKVVKMFFTKKHNVPQPPVGTDAEGE